MCVGVCMCMSLVCLFTHLRATLLYLKSSLFNTRMYTHILVGGGGWHFAECLGSREERWHREPQKASSAVSISIIISYQQHWGPDPEQKWQAVNTWLDRFVLLKEQLVHYLSFDHFTLYSKIQKALTCYMASLRKNISLHIIFCTIKKKSPQTLKCS